MNKQCHKGMAMVLLIISAPVVFGMADAQDTAISPMPINYGPVKEAVSLLIKKEMRKNDVPGLSIALVDNQQVVWAQGFGYADEKREVPAGPETVYWVGSLTNVFTATAAMQLVEQGKLNLDQPLLLYLPEFSVRTRYNGNGNGQITLRHLLTHHSGLPSAIQKGMWCNKPEPFSTVVNLLKDEYAACPPGYIFSYSSIDMTLTGHVVERVSGREYVSYMRESLLQPLNMTKSGFSPASTANGSLSKGYNKGKEIEDPAVRDVPAVGLSSTVLDMGRFMQMVFAQGRSNGHQILMPDTLAEMFRPQNNAVPLDLGLRVGLGWVLSGLGEIDIRNAGTVAHHAGGTLLFHSQMVLLPEHKLGVVVMANSSTSAPVVNKAALRALTLALEAKAGIKQPANKRAMESDMPLPQEVMREYAGLYASTAGLAEIKPNPRHFHAEIMNRTLQLTPLDDGRFGISFKLLGLFPISLGELDYFELSHARVAGHEILKAGTKGRDFLIAEKIHAVPLSDAWLKRVGAYTINKPGDDFPVIEDIHLLSEDGILLIECNIPFFFKGTVRFPLKPISDTEMIFAGLGYGLGETIRVVQVNGREALRYSGYVLVKSGE